MSLSADQKEAIMAARGESAAAAAPSFGVFSVTMTDVRADGRQKKFTMLSPSIFDRDDAERYVRRRFGSERVVSVEAT